MNRNYSTCRSAPFREPRGIISRSHAPELRIENTDEIFCDIHGRVIAKRCLPEPFESQ
jgi:hypothetical protein